MQQEYCRCPPKQPGVQLSVGWGGCEGGDLTAPAEHPCLSPARSCPSSCKHITMSEEPLPVLSSAPHHLASPFLPLLLPTSPAGLKVALALSQPLSPSPGCPISSSTDLNSFFHPQTKKRRDSLPPLRPAHQHANMLYKPT